MSAEALDLIFRYFSRKDVSQDEAVANLLLGPHRKRELWPCSGCAQPLSVSWDTFVWFVFARPLLAYGHLHSEHSLLSFQNMSFNYKPSSECCTLYGQLMCPSANTSTLIPVPPPIDRLIFNRPTLSTFQIERGCVKLLFSRVTVFYATEFSMPMGTSLCNILYCTLYFQHFFREHSFI